MSEVIERVKEAYRVEQLNQRPPIDAEDLPLSYETITNEWLTNVICSDHPGAKVSGHRLGPVDDGSTSRRRIFIDYNNVGQRAGLPPSVFAKASHKLSARLSGGIAGAVFGEYTFYTKIRSQLLIEAPECVWANYNPETLNSIIMLRDLGSETEFCTLSTDMTEERLRGQMALLANFHGHFYEGGRHEHVIAELPTWPDWFTRLTAVGLEKHCDNGFAAAKDVIPARFFARRSEVWPATLESVKRHNELPHTLVHSDPHLRNWYISAKGEMGLTDWQCACRAHWSRDLAYALTAAVDVGRRRRLQEPLMRYYLTKLHESGGAQISYEEAWKLCRQQLFSALAWWTYTMPIPGIGDKQPLDATLEMIKRISHAIDDNDALNSFV